MWRRLAIVVVVGCACTTHDGSGDADAARGVDGGATDATHDAGRDATAVDVGVDAYEPEGFVLASGGSFPDSARVAFALPSLVAATTFAVEPCPWRAGCRRIVQTWPSGVCMGQPLPCSPFVVGEANGEHDGTVGRVVIGRQTEAHAAEVWVVDDTGRALLGVRSAVPPSPYVGVGSVHRASIALDVYVGQVGADYQEFLLVAPFSDPFSFIDLGEVNHNTPPTGDIMQRFRLGDTAVAGEMTSLVIQRIPLDGSAPSIATGGEGTLGSIVGDTIVFDRFTSPPGDIRIARPGEVAEVLIAGPQTNATRVSSDGHDLVWIEYDYDAGGQGTNLAVWTAPYVEHAADVVARRIDSPPVVSLADPLTVGFGYASMPYDGGAARIYRLSDGYHADLAPPAGDYWMPASYVGPTEIAIAAYHGQRADSTQLCFIELASLDWVPGS